MYLKIPAQRGTGTETGQGALTRQQKEPANQTCASFRHDTTCSSSDVHKLFRGDSTSPGHHTCPPAHLASSQAEVPCNSTSSPSHLLYTSLLPYVSLCLSLQRRTSTPHPIQASAVAGAVETQKGGAVPLDRDRAAGTSFCTSILHPPSTLCPPRAPRRGPAATYSLCTHTCPSASAPSFCLHQGLRTLSYILK